MRDLNPSDVDSLISIKGMVIRVGSIVPDLKMAFFRCSKCMAHQEVMLDRGRIDHPSSCTTCAENHCMEIVHNRCIFSNLQIVKMQESPDMVRDGETPYTITLHLYDDLVDVAKPGDRIEVTGDIYIYTYI
jgi:DNA replication licensing factor MCM4